jgi:AcrR family transcriptional regulator
MTRATRTNPDVRKELILDAAVQLSTRIGYNRITRDAVAELAHVSSSLLHAYFPRMESVRRAVMEVAIKREIVEIIAQGLALNDARARKINKTLRQKVMTYISTLN